MSIAANLRYDCSLTRAMDGRIVCWSISCQSAATSEIVKRFWSRTHVRSAITINDDDMMMNVLLIGLQEDRLRGRGTETEESLSKRLAVAKAELQYGRLLAVSLCDLLSRRRLEDSLLVTTLI